MAPPGPSLDAAAEVAVRAACEALLASTSPTQVSRVLGGVAAAVGRGWAGWAGGREGGDTLAAEEEKPAPPCTSFRPVSTSRTVVEESVAAALAAAAAWRAAAEAEAAAKEEEGCGGGDDNTDAATALAVASLHRGGRYASLADALLSGERKSKHTGCG